MPSGTKLNIQKGDVFGRLTVIKEVSKYDKRRYFECICQCGTVRQIRLDALAKGVTKSCGCLNREISSNHHTKHGMYKERIHKIWRGMKGRCLSKGNSHFHNYGGRGIKICEEWLDFKNFYNWAIENGYNDNLTIERVNVNGHYEPGNCTWITMTEQKRNTRKSKKLTFRGKTLTLRQWAKEIGINSGTLSLRFKNGWTLEQALTTPRLKKGEKLVR